MPKLAAFLSLRDAMKTKRTRRERFLAQVDAVMPWGRLRALIAPHDPKMGPKGGRPPMPPLVMFRVYFMQNRDALSDPMSDETLYDSAAMRRFAGVGSGGDRIPDETTILNVRHLLEGHGLTPAIFADVNAHPADKGITFRFVTLVDATIIDAPSLTKTKAGVRDPEKPSTRMGNDWYFGMKAHIGVDADSAVTHNPETSTARLHDSQVRDNLLHGEETWGRADKGYVSTEREDALRGLGKDWGVLRKAPKGDDQATMTADLKPRKPPPETRLAPARPIRPLPRRSRTTLSDVPQIWW